MRRRRGDLTVIISRSAELRARRYRISQKFLIKLDLLWAFLLLPFPCPRCTTITCGRKQRIMIC